MPKSRSKSPHKAVQRDTARGKVKPPAEGLSSIQLPRPEVNGRISLVMVPEFAPSDPRAAIVRSEYGSPGIYGVTFVLAIPGRNSFLEDLNVASLMQSGTSPLVSPHPGALLKTSLTNQDDTFEVVFASNDQGFLSKAMIRIEAQTFEDAERAAHDRIFPILSSWSYYYDVAIDIAAYEVLEEQTLSKKWVFGAVGRAKLFDASQHQLPEVKYRRILAVYREAMNATNPYYQVLSFYKVTTAVQKLRDVRRQDAQARGEEIRQPSEQIPERIEDLQISSTGIQSLFQPHLGKKFTAVLQHYARVIRNAIAHLDPTGEEDLLDADHFDDLKTCEKAMPILHYIARCMLTTELDPRLIGPSTSVRQANRELARQESVPIAPAATEGAAAPEDALTDKPDE